MRIFCCRVLVLIALLGIAAVHPGTAEELGHSETASACVGEPRGVNSTRPQGVSSQTTNDPIEELRVRIQRLEQEQAALHARLGGLDAGAGGLPRALGPTHGPTEMPLAAGGREPGSVGWEEHAWAFAVAQDAAPPASAPQAQGSVVGEDRTLQATWRNGLELSSRDKAFRVHVGGRWQFDTAWMSAADAVQRALPGGVAYHDGVDFRRARLRVDGTMYEVIEYAFEYDFVNSLRVRNGPGTGVTDEAVPAVTDLWLQVSHTPVGNWRIGCQKEAIGFEHIVSSRFLPFMERSYNQDTFYGGSFNGFTPGISLSRTIWEDRASWNIGLYKPTNNVFGSSVSDGDYAITGRVTWLPVYENEGRQLVHLGFSARQATTYDDRIRFRTRDAVRGGLSVQWPVPADITVLGSTMQWLNGELAMVQGPWTVQAEWLVSLTSNARRLDATGMGTGPVVDGLMYHGGYIQVLYFLTGESDYYSLERAAFDRVTPLENFFWVPGDEGSFLGTGAWQVGARYNLLDLNDQGINGGILHNLTVGLNWFWNPNTKWQFNYIATYRDVSRTADFSQGSGWVHGWGMRLAQDF